MQSVAIFKAGLLTLTLLAGGIAAAHAADDTEMIVGGTPAPEGKYPYQVRLYYSMDDTKGGCGGSLVADQWVLTAGHCVVVDHNLPADLTASESVYVGYGSTDRTKTTKIKSAKIFVHPNYLARGFDGKADIALVKLESPVPNAPIVPYADPELDQKLAPPGTKVTITGWGAIWDPEDKDVLGLLSELTPPHALEEKLNFPLKLQEVEVEIVDPEACKAALRPLEVGQTEICVLKPGTPKNSCYGDSGGPLVVPADNARGFVQVGVVSWGVRCGREIVPNIFARVSAFSDWMQETMAANAGPETPAAAPEPAAEPEPAGEPEPEDEPEQ